MTDDRLKEIRKHLEANTEYVGKFQFAAHDKTTLIGQTSALLACLKERCDDIRYLLEQVEALRGELKAKHMECESLKNCRDDRTEAIFSERKACAERDRLKAAAGKLADALGRILNVNDLPNIYNGMSAHETIVKEALAEYHKLQGEKG